MFKVVYLLVATFIASAALYGGAAIACDTCGCQDAAAAAACSCPDGECSCGAADAAMAACADCPMSGDCACGPKNAATAGCPFAHAAAQNADNLPDGHVQAPADLHVSMQQLESFEVAYIPGTFGDDMEALFGELMAAAGQQGLLNDTTHVGAVLSGVQYAEPTDETAVHVAIWSTNGHQVSAPIQSETIPGGTYMVVQHWGDYDHIGETYMRAISWAQESGIEFPNQPSFVHHVTDPASAPSDQWLTEIYLPFTHSAS